MMGPRGKNWPKPLKSSPTRFRKLREGMGTRLRRDGPLALDNPKTGHSTVGNTTATLWTRRLRFELPLRPNLLA